MLTILISFKYTDIFVTIILLKYIVFYYCQIQNFKYRYLFLIHVHIGIRFKCIIFEHNILFFYKNEIKKYLRKKRVLSIYCKYIVSNI